MYQNIETDSQRYLQDAQRYFFRIIAALQFTPNLETILKDHTINPSMLDMPFNMIISYLFERLYFQNHTTPYELELTPENCTQSAQIAVIIPTINEPMDMLQNTIQSVLNQEYPTGLITIVVSDDSERGRDNKRKEEVQRLIQLFRESNPKVKIQYHDAIRTEGTGKAKAGNLNFAILALQTTNDTNYKYIWVQDADDKIPNPFAFKVFVHNMEYYPNLAFIQGHKDFKPNSPDPFGNNEALFYEFIQKIMDQNMAPISCGSGVCYRAGALEEIGGFQEILVEDVPTTLELFLKGFYGGYTEKISTADAQSAPNNIRDFHRQRVQWATAKFEMFFRRFKSLKDAPPQAKELMLSVLVENILYLTPLLLIGQSLYQLNHPEYTNSVSNIYPIALLTSILLNSKVPISETMKSFRNFSGMQIHVLFNVIEKIINKNNKLYTPTPKNKAVISQQEKLMKVMPNILVATILFMPILDQIVNPNDIRTFINTLNTNLIPLFYAYMNIWFANLAKE